MRLRRGAASAVEVVVVVVLDLESGLLVAVCEIASSGLWVVVAAVAPSGGAALFFEGDFPPRFLGDDDDDDVAFAFSFLGVSFSSSRAKCCWICSGLR